MLGRISLFLMIAAMSVSVLDCQSNSGPSHGKVVVCYVSTWAVYRPLAGSYSLDDIDPTLCTHVIYAFAGLNQTSLTIRSLDPWQDLPDDGGKDGYNRLVSMKNRYPHLKVSIAIGGWNEGSPNYSKMAETAESRRKFVNSVLQFLNKHKFDGLDLDWEYPTLREGRPQDKANFVALAKELKEAFNPRGYLLTAALGVGPNTMESAYDLPMLNRHLDFIHVMCYDYHGKWDGVVGANAPLNGSGEMDPLSVDYSIRYMLKHGISASKIVVGVPMYGRAFLLQDPNTRDIIFGSTSVNTTASFQGPFTREAGFMGYNEICRELNNKSSSWERHWNDQNKVPYIRDGARVVTYDNERSVALKVKMAMDFNLRGIMVWSIDTDDFRGECLAKTEDAYVDFVERYETLKNDPLLRKALKTLKLHDMNSPYLGKDVYYMLSEGELKLRFPTLEYSNYPLMRTINEAITLSLEEKKILDEMDRISKGNEIEIETEKPKAPDSASLSPGSLFTVALCLGFAWLFS